MDSFINKKEIRNFKNYNNTKKDLKSIRSYYNNISNYKNVNNIYLMHGTTFNDACSIAKVSKRSYYRACKELKKDTITMLIKNNKNDSNQHGGDKENIDDDKYRLTEHDSEYNKHTQFITKLAKEGI